MSPRYNATPRKEGAGGEGTETTDRWNRDGTLVFPPIWQQAIGLFSACLLLVLQIFVGRSAEKIAFAISEEADCFARGIRYAEVSRTISPTPEVAQSVLVALREKWTVGA